MRVLILHNPRAGRGRVSKTTLVRAFSRAGHSIRYRSVRDKGWRRGVSAAAADVVVAVGGDGAVAKVARLLAQRRSRTPLAILPTGTANNIARGLGMTGSLPQLVAGLETAAHSRLAVGLARGPWGMTRFLESAGVGPIATLIADAPDRGTLRGTMAYVRRAVEDAPLRPMRVRVDGVRISGRYVMVQVMNINAIGPRLELAPEADPGDDWLDVVLVGEAELPTFRRYLAARAGHRAARCPIVARRARRIEIGTWPADAGAHVDDAIWPEKPRSGSGAVHLRVDTTIPILVPER